MKIAIVTSSFPLDPSDPAAAAGLFVRDFAVALANAGNSVHVLTQDKGSGCQSPPSNIEVSCYPWAGRRKALSQLKLFKPMDMYSAVSLTRNAYTALKHIHKKNQLDHVLAMWAVPAGLTARKLFLKHKVPYSVWCLGSDIWTYGRLPLLKTAVRRVIQRAKLCYADGIELGNEAEKLSGRPFTFLPSSRKLPVGKYDAAISGSPSPKFLFVGRYTHVKGIDIMLDAFADFRKREGRGVLNLFGGGPLKSQIQQQVKALGLSGFAIVGDLADVETVVSFGKASDAFIIPSRNESIPVILSDAIQIGKPVIATDVGDMGKFVDQAKAGIVVPAENSAELSNAMSVLCNSLANNPDHFSKGIKQLASRFDIQASAKQFSESVRQLDLSTPDHSNERAAK